MINYEFRNPVIKILSERLKCGAKILNICPYYSSFYFRGSKKVRVKSLLKLLSTYFSNFKNPSPLRESKIFLSYAISQQRSCNPRKRNLVKKSS